jgi:hypothetical protein
MTFFKPVIKPDLSKLYNNFAFQLQYCLFKAQIYSIRDRNPKPSILSQHLRLGLGPK